MIYLDLKKEFELNKGEFGILLDENLKYRVNDELRAEISTNSFHMDDTLKDDISKGRIHINDDTLQHEQSKGRININVVREIKIREKVIREEFKEGRRKLFKDLNRLEAWLNLARWNSFKSSEVGYVNPIIIERLINISDTNEKSFVLAGLIIIFQIFEDANHRTANFYFKQKTGYDITYAQMEKIRQLSLYNYDWVDIILVDPETKVNDLVNDLSIIYTTSNNSAEPTPSVGGKLKKKKIKSIKNKTKKVKSKNNSKTKQQKKEVIINKN